MGSVLWMVGFAVAGEPAPGEPVADAGGGDQPAAEAGQAAEARDPARTEEIAKKEWTVSIDPLTTAIGFVHLQVERSFGRRVSVYATPSIRFFDGILPRFNGPWYGAGVEVGVRGFFIGNAPKGGWVMLRGVLGNAWLDNAAATSRISGYTSLLVGYTGILGPGIVLSGGAGASYFDYGVAGYGVYGFAPALHTNVGWAF